MNNNQCCKPYDPFNSVRELLGDDVLGLSFYPKLKTTTARHFAAIDLSEEKDKVVIKADLPGIKKEDIKVELDQDGVLTISGERNFVNQEKQENITRLERYFGSFSRSFYLGDTVDPERINANYKDGVLEVTLGKKAKAQPKAIDVKVE